MLEIRDEERKDWRKMNSQPHYSSGPALWEGGSPFPHLLFFKFDMLSSPASVLRFGQSCFRCWFLLGVYALSFWVRNEIETRWKTSNKNRKLSWMVCRFERSKILFLVLDPFLVFNPHDLISRFFDPHDRSLLILICNL